jgi:hypothetical protein
MKKNKNYQIKAFFITMLFVGSMISVSTSAIRPTINNDYSDSENIWVPLNQWEYHQDAPNRLDVPYYYETTSFDTGSFADVGYNVDAGNEIRHSFKLYIGEPVDETRPGNGRTGNLGSPNKDTSDWYTFTACNGQSYQASLTLHPR